MISSWLAPSVTICAVIIAALLTYYNNSRLHVTQERLKWINAQLGDFYGPLYSISEASGVAWIEFNRQIDTLDRASWNFEFTDIERREWIYWMSNVFMPANRRMYEIIVSRSHLLVGDKMPEVLSEFCAHTSTYEVIVNKWRQGDEVVIISKIAFPVDFREYISTTFLSLKRQQQELLRRVEPGRKQRFRPRRKT